MGNATITLYNNTDPSDPTLTFTQATLTPAGATETVPVSGTFRTVAAGDYVKLTSDGGATVGVVDITMIVEA